IGSTIDILGSQHRLNSPRIKTLCAGSVVLSGASLLGIAWAGAIFLFLLLYWSTIRKQSLWEVVSDNYLTIAITLLCIAALLAHDIRMFTLGKRAVLLHESNILTMVFSFYTNLGLLGIGPGMLDLRANGIGALMPFIPIIAFSTILFGLIAIGGLCEIRNMF